MKPRPKRLIHVIPGHGSIADRFEDVYAWPPTSRKTPGERPEPEPEGECFAGDSLAGTKSVEKLFAEYLTRESAFRAPLISVNPTHAAVGIVRSPGGQYLYTAVVYVQINSTRVLKELEQEFRDLTTAESRASSREVKAERLRALARFGDLRSLPLFRKRLSLSRGPEVLAAALDGLFLNAPAEAAEWVEKRSDRIAKAHDSGAYASVIPLLTAFAAVEYDLRTRRRAEEDLAFVTRLAQAEIDAAVRLADSGETEKAREELTRIAAAYRGLPIAETAAKKAEELPATGGDDGGR
jgi:hypothetical protein